MKIAVDLDGVCYKFTKGFSDYLRVRLDNPGITEDKITKWNWWEIEEFGITQEEWLRCFDEFTRHRMWQGLELFPEAKEALVSLYEQGGEIYYITARPRESRRSTVKAILSDGLPFDGITFAKNKAEIAVALDAKYAIDDSLRNMFDYCGHGAIRCILIDRLYNKIDPRGSSIKNHPEAKGFNYVDIQLHFTHGYIRRVNNIVDAVNEIIALENKEEV